MDAQCHRGKDTAMLQVDTLRARVTKYTNMHVNGNVTAPCLRLALWLLDSVRNGRRPVCRQEVWLWEVLVDVAFMGAQVYVYEYTIGRRSCDLPVQGEIMVHMDQMVFLCLSNFRNGATHHQSVHVSRDEAGESSVNIHVATCTGTLVGERTPIGSPFLSYER